jgi:hypothetical protein
MAFIFLSYRREDSIAYAGRLHDRLAEHFGAQNVFMDVDTLETGVDFVDILQQAVAFPRSPRYACTGTPSATARVFSP